MIAYDCNDFKFFIINLIQIHRHHEKYQLLENLTLRINY